MADIANRYPENTAGKYYVDNQCIDCDLCRETAPDNFTRNEDGSWHIHDSIRNRVSFGRLNLYDEPRVSLLGHLDVIFCRNVIIYFDDLSKKVVVSNFYNRLTDAGYLLLGHSESLISLSTQFKLRHLKNDMVYQK